MIFFLILNIIFLNYLYFRLNLETFKYFIKINLIFNGADTVFLIVKLQIVFQKRVMYNNTLNFFKAKNLFPENFAIFQFP